MQCIFCDKKTVVINSRSRTYKIWRRRQCPSCKKVFSTYERPDVSNLFIIKDNKLDASKKRNHQAFNNTKLLLSVAKACDHMSFGYEAHVENIVLEVVTKVAHIAPDHEINSLALTKIVADHIKKLDKVAFIKYCSAHSLTITDV